MTGTLGRLSWSEANQALMVAEFAQLKRKLGEETNVASLTPEEARKSFDESTAAIDQLTEIFSLTAFERELLLLCAGVEMDSDLAARSGEAQGQDSRAPVTFGLAMGTLTDPHWSALTPARPLRRFQLIHLDAKRSLTTAPLRIDERVLHFLAGTNLLDARLDSLLRAPDEPALLATEHRASADRVIAALSREEPPAILLCGNDASAQEDIANLAAHELGLRLLCIRAEDLPVPGAELDQILLLLERESLLLPAAVLLQCGDGGLGPAVRRLAERLPGAVFVASRESLRLHRAVLPLDVDKPGPEEQRQLWQAALGPAASDLAPLLDEIADQFSLSAETIFSTSSAMAASEAPAPRALWDACRAHSRPKLEALAQRITPSSDWDDLVLPEAQSLTLRRLVAQVRHRMQVHQGWGFSSRGSRGLGVSALFSGESGTGKTLAAEVLASELRLDLYRIDLSSVVSKYIGETEKNLRQVFDAAENGGVLLLFDEADALFGKRTEIKDSHDRYANIEVGYLLQRMEAYQGLALLTTNLKSSLDRAFQRRLRFIVNFPFPDAAQREAIWRRIFPARTPSSGLDYARLAQLNVAGGSIRNIALSAAFLAAESGAPVTMQSLLEAARMEAQKIERPLATAEIRGWE